MRSRWDGGAAEIICGNDLGRKGPSPIIGSKDQEFDHAPVSAGDITNA